MIEIINLTAYYGKNPIIKNLFLSINKGDILGVTGTNGAGKTSLLKMIAGINNEVRHDLHSIKYQNGKPSVSYVHQNFHKGLFPWFDVYKNIAMPLIIKGDIPESTCIEEAKNLCEVFKFNVDSTEIYKLSGGQNQKIALLRSIINKPEILLLDEPFSAIDTLKGRGADFRFYFLKYLVEHKITTLFVSHNSKELTYLANKILFCYRNTNKDAPYETMRTAFVELESRNIENRNTILVEDNTLDAIIESKLLKENFERYLIE